METIKSVPVFQCANGHVICKVCIAKLNNCPICRNDSALVRSLKLENIVEKLEGIQPEKMGPTTAKIKWGKGSVRSYGTINGPTQVGSVLENPRQVMPRQDTSRQATPMQATTREATPRQAMPRRAPPRQATQLWRNRLIRFCKFLGLIIGFCAFAFFCYLVYYFIKSYVQWWSENCYPLPRSQWC
jgi:hypothetical protein